MRREGKKIDRKNLGATGEKALLGSEPGRQAGRRGNTTESSSVVQTSTGTNTPHAFLGHFIFPSACLWIHAPYKSAAVWSMRLSMLDHLMGLTWSQLTDLKRHFPSKALLSVCLKKTCIWYSAIVKERKSKDAESEPMAEALTFLISRLSALHIP